MFVRNQLLFSPEEGETQTGGGEPVQKQEKPEISLQDAIRTIEKIGGKVFPSESGYNNALKATRGNWEADVRGKIKEAYGVGWNDGEQLDEYVKRASGEFIKKATPQEKKELKEDEDFLALKKALETKNSELEEYKSKLTNYEKSQIESEKESLLLKGLPLDKLDYDDFAKKGIIRELKESIKEKYDFQKDEKGWKVINKATGELIPDSEGNRKSIEAVVSDYTKSLQDLKLKNGKVSNLPGDSSEPLSEAALNSAKAKALAEIQSKGLYGHERTAAQIRKKWNVASPNDLAFLSNK